MPIIYRESDAFAINDVIEEQSFGRSTDIIGRADSEVMELLKMILGAPLPLILSVEEKRKIRITRREKR